MTRTTPHERELGVDKESQPAKQPGTAVRGGFRFGPIDVHCVGLFLLFVVEGLVFYSQLANRITPFHPVAFDQTAYMLQAYHLIDAFQTKGWDGLFAPILRPASATGVTFTVQGALLMLIGGPNRTAMLSLNLIYFIALQLTLFHIVRARLQRADMAWIAVALLLSTGSLFFFAGSLMDFRIDFAALCTYGIWLCLLIHSDGFRDFRVGVIVTAVGVWLVLMRFITVVYLGAVFGGLLIALLLAAWFAATPTARLDHLRRARNLFVSGGLTGALAFPVLFAVRGQLYGYYGVGHFFGEEKYIRAAENGIFTLWDHLRYYPKTLQLYHLGSLTLWLLGIVAAASLVLALLAGRASLRQTFERIRRNGFDLLACALAAIVPLTILTLDFAKSPVVGNITIVPIILFAVILCAAFWPLESASADPARHHSAHSLVGVGRAVGTGLRAYAVRAICVVVFIGAFAGFLSSSATETTGYARLDRERIVALNEGIARYALDNSLGSPRMSFDRVADYLNIGTVELYGYERFRHFLNSQPRLGHGAHGIFATPRDVALKLVMDSDVVVLTDPLLDRGHAYPMNVKIKEYWGELWQWANENLATGPTVSISGIPHHVFMRVNVKVGGLSGPWITSAGLMIEVEARHLARWPFILLEGMADENHHNARLGGRPKPRALVADDSAELPASFDVVGQNFRIVIDAGSLAKAAGVKRIKLTFDRFFVPKQVGLNEDTRELVIVGPTSWSLHAKPPN